MASSNLNRVVLTGNLTADTDLRSLPSGTSVCKLRVASNTRRKDSASGEYVDKPNYFDVTVWGAQGENCARYPSRGRGWSGSTGAWSGASGRPTAGRQAPVGRDHRRRRAVPGGPPVTQPARRSESAPPPQPADAGPAPDDDDIPF